MNLIMNEQMNEYVRILEEFQKAKQSYEDSLAAAKTSSQSKLKNRMKKKSEQEAAANDVQASLETVVDSFLADPVNFKASSVAAKRKTAAIERDLQEKGDKEATEDIKNRHREKEQSLVNYYRFVTILGCWTDDSHFSR